MSTFDGIPATAARFYSELEQNNNREWWQVNATAYEESVKGPLQALLAQLEPRFGPSRLFRPNRDISGGGYHSHSPAQLLRYRHSVDAGSIGEQLQRIVEAIAAAGFAIEGEKLKTVPRGFPRTIPAPNS